MTHITQMAYPALLALIAFPSSAQSLSPAQDKGLANDEPRIYTLDPSTHGNPEGIAYDKTTRSFFVGATGDGTIYRGTLDNKLVSPYIPGGPGKEAAGLKVFQGKLYVAGGFSGAVSVYSIATKQMVASFQNFGAGMLNDLVVAANGDVFVTDSFVPRLWHIKAAQVAAGVGAPNGIPLDPEIQYLTDPDPFNLNGIVALKGGRSLIVVQSNNGKLYRIDLDQNAPLGRRICPIAVDPLIGADGLLLDRNDLIVVQGGPPGVLSFVRLDGKVTRGRVIERWSDPSLRFPSTVARARNFYLVVNADFINNAPPFTVTGFPFRFSDDDE